jgi:hypothetical protein
MQLLHTAVEKYHNTPTFSDIPKYGREKVFTYEDDMFDFYKPGNTTTVDQFIEAMQKLILKLYWESYPQPPNLPLQMNAGNYYMCCNQALLTIQKEIIWNGED